jgi:hypothetical protein
MGEGQTTWVWVYNDMADQNLTVASTRLESELCPETSNQWSGRFPVDGSVNSVFSTQRLGTCLADYAGMQTVWVFGDAADIIGQVLEPYVSGYLTYGGST